MATETARHKVAGVTEEMTGQSVKRRRLALGLSVRQMADESGMSRATVAKIEADDETVEDYTRARLGAALDRLEHRYGVEDPEQVTTRLELPDGTVAFFTGSPANVAETLSEFLRRRG